MIKQHNLDAYLKASAVLTDIGHGTNLSIVGSEGPNKYTVSDKFAPDYKLSIELDFDSETPINVIDGSESRGCKTVAESQEYILRLVTAYRLKTDK